MRFWILESTLRIDLMRNYSELLNFSDYDSIIRMNARNSLQINVCYTRFESHILFYVNQYVLSAMNEKRAKCSINRNNNVYIYHWRGACLFAFWRVRLKCKQLNRVRKRVCTAFIVLNLICRRIRSFYRIDLQGIDDKKIQFVRFELMFFTNYTIINTIILLFIFAKSVLVNICTI